MSIENILVGDAKLLAYIAIGAAGAVYTMANLAVAFYPLMLEKITKLDLGTKKEIEEESKNCGKTAYYVYIPGRKIFYLLAGKK